MVMFVPHTHKVLTNVYHGWGKAFNRRGFLSLMYQGEPAYMFHATEHGSQRVLRIRANWMQILQRYSFTNGYTWTQHVPLNVRTVINRPGTDPQHAGLSSSLYHSGTALA